MGKCLPGWFVGQKLPQSAHITGEGAFYIGASFLDKGGSYVHKAAKFFVAEWYSGVWNILCHLFPSEAEVGREGLRRAVVQRGLLVGSEGWVARFGRSTPPVLFFLEDVLNSFWFTKLEKHMRRKVEIKRTIYFHSSHVIFAHCLVFSLILIWLQWPLVVHISRVIPRI